MRRETLNERQQKIEAKSSQAPQGRAHEEFRVENHWTKGSINRLRHGVLANANFRQHLTQPKRPCARFSGRRWLGDALETKTFDEQKRTDKKREVSDHRPIIGHACAINER